MNLLGVTSQLYKARRPSDNPLRANSDAAILGLETQRVIFLRAIKLLRGGRALRMVTENLPLSPKQGWPSRAAAR